MNFRDTLITCEECGKQFIFTVESQRRMADRGQEIQTPTTCPTCTHKVRYGGRLHGRIKWFSEEKGYGFLVEDSGKELFFHRNSVVPTPEGGLPALADGQDVLYDIEESVKGPQAAQVTPFS